MFISTFGIHALFSVAVVGSGGKSSLICQITKEAIQRRWLTVVTTTTHIHMPFLPTDISDILCSRHISSQMLWDFPTTLVPKAKIVISHLVNPQKAKGFSAEEIATWKSTTHFSNTFQQENTFFLKDASESQNILQNFTPQHESGLLLIEADGSRGVPMKVPAPWEPVIPANVDMTIIVVNLTCLMRPLLSTWIHRIDQLYSLGITIPCVITPKLIADIIWKTVLYRNKIPACSKTGVYFSACQTFQDFQNAKDIAYYLRTNGFVGILATGNLYPTQILSCTPWINTI